jgi:membrane protease YdiL (CAAX protease family)
LLVALFLGLAAGGAAFQKAAGAHPSLTQRPPQVVPIYLSMLIGEWGLILYVWRAGLRRSGATLSELIGGRWSSWGDFVRDAGLAVVLCAGAKIVMSGMERLLGHGHDASIEGFLPRHAVEVTLWVLLSLSAGFVEELVFRGYFQRQFEAWTRSPSIALLFQAAFFGVAHGYQGALACSKIAVFGVLFGLVALWRKSLRPGMIAHALTDIVGGIARI